MPVRRVDLHMLNSVLYNFQTAMLSLARDIQRFLKHCQTGEVWKLKILAGNSNFKIWVAEINWNTLLSTLGCDKITFSGFIWGQELITKCPCWVKLHITEDNFLPLFKPPQFRFFLSKNVKLFEAIRSPLINRWYLVRCGCAADKL